MTLPVIINRFGKVVRDNSPSILTAIGVSGTVTTAYLAAKAGHAHAIMMADREPYMSNRDHAELVWKLYIPAGLSGTATIVCIIGARQVGSRRTAALTAAYSLSDKAFTEYREKIVEVIGEKKEQTVRDAIAQDRINANPPSEGKALVVAGAGNILCCELYTGRYFYNDMETLRKAQNDVNSKINHHDCATLNDFYELVGLASTANSWDFGWTSEKLLVLEFSTVMSEDSRPCIAFNYNYTTPIN